MKNFLLKSLPPQSTKLYSLLKGKKPMTAKDIGKQLDIFPHAVYRAIKPLKEIGLVKELDTYPITFQALHESDAVDILSSTIRKNYYQIFTSPSESDKNQPLDISFINNRDDLLNKSNKDIKFSTKTVYFVVSGLEVPAETILVFKQAIERGVVVKAIVQRLDETSEAMFRNWGKIGVHVKYYPNMEARIFIIDGRIVYFTSYDPFKKDEATGMRFNYSAYAKLMGELFERRWKIAKGI